MTRTPLEFSVMKKRLSTIAKIAVTLAGLAYVITQAPVERIGDEFVNLDWRWLLLAMVLVLGGFVLRAYRWLLLWRGLHVPIPFSRLVALYFVGSFFNTFLPTGFGGDVVRVLEVSQDVSPDLAAGTVIMDRVTGLIMLFVMALLALPFRPPEFPQTLLIYLTAVALIGILGGVLLVEGRLIRRWGAWLPGKLSVTDEKQPLARLLRAVQGGGWRVFVQALAVSTLFNLLLFTLWYAVGRALGYSVSYSYYLLIVPIMALALLVPSISGLGVRETIAPLLFAGAGLTAVQAVSLTLLVFVVQRAAGLAGAPVYLASVLRGWRVTAEMKHRELGG